MVFPNLTVLLGCYGSGKTNIAINIALKQAAQGEKVTAVDLDMINPYFRMTDGAELLKEAGVTCLFSDYANTNVDIPQHSPKVKTLLSSVCSENRVVMDVGGDDTGAVALGMYSAQISASGGATWLVLNKYRPFVQTLEDVKESLAVIEAASRVKFNGIVANPNLGKETTAETVMETIPYYEQISQMLGIPVVCLCAEKKVCDELEKDRLQIPWEILPIRIFRKPGWEIYD